MPVRDDRLYDTWFRANVSTRFNYPLLLLGRNLFTREINNSRRFDDCRSSIGQPFERSIIPVIHRPLETKSNFLAFLEWDNLIVDFSEKFILMIDTNLCI